MPGSNGFTRKSTAPSAYPRRLARRVVRVGGEEDDRRLVSVGTHPEQPRGLEPVEHRHLHVEDDDRELLLGRQGERPRARGGLNQAELEPVQDRREREEVVGVVVDEQDARAHRRIVRGQGLVLVPAGHVAGTTRLRAIVTPRERTVDLRARTARVVTGRGGYVWPRPPGSPGAARTPAPYRACRAEARSGTTERDLEESAGELARPRMRVGDDQPVEQPAPLEAAVPRPGEHPVRGQRGDPAAPASRYASAAAISDPPVRTMSS